MPQEPRGGPEQQSSPEPDPQPSPHDPTSQDPTSQGFPTPESSGTPEDSPSSPDSQGSPTTEQSESDSPGHVQDNEEAVHPRIPEHAQSAEQAETAGHVQTAGQPDNPEPPGSTREAGSAPEAGSTREAGSAREPVSPEPSGSTREAGSTESGTGSAEEGRSRDDPAGGADASEEPLRGADARAEPADAASPAPGSPAPGNADPGHADPDGPVPGGQAPGGPNQDGPNQGGPAPDDADEDRTDQHGPDQDADRSLELTGISKSFPGVRALHQVDFDVRPGEVHVLLGENGAGKSTLIRVLAGVHRPDAGMVSVAGQAVRVRGPQHAEQLGIATVHQETSLVPQLTVAENIHLGRPPRRFGVLSRRRMLRSATELVERLGLDLDPRARVADLGVAERQQVEIAKALRAEARFLVLDEPTAVLGPDGVERLFAVVAELTARGVGVVFISHLLDEVARIGDRATVLRDGAKVAEVPASTDTGELARLMVGRPLGRQHPRRAPEVGDVRLDVRGLTRRGAFEDVSFTARVGEVVGLGGMVGAGRTELVRAVFGADRYDRGEVRVGDRRVRRGSVAAARRAGMALVPEDRAGQALLPDASVEENLGLATLARSSRLGLVALGAQRASAERTVRELAIRASHPSQPVSALSGGNQQKVVLGRWLLARPEVLILDEPTRGVDVGARSEIYDLVNDLTDRGTTVLVVSSDLPELLGLSDRVLVLADGRLRGELPRAEATQQRVLELAAGGPGGSRNG